jgi:CRP-like cAMP-binding protein
MNAIDLIGAVQADWPRQIFKAGARIIAPGDTTDVAFIIQTGHATGFDGTLRRRYAAGDLLATLDFLALNTYQSAVTATDQVAAFMVSRTQIRDLIDRQHHLTWPLSCLLAIDMQKRNNITGAQ